MNSNQDIIQRLESEPEIIHDHSLQLFQLVNKLDYAVLTKQCLHQTKPVELSIILQSKICSECNKQISNDYDLIKSPTEWALTYFSENPTDLNKRKQCKTQKCCILKGYYFHHYSRDKKFWQVLQDNHDIVKILIENKNSENNFVTKCKNDPIIRNIPLGHLFQYKPICLLDQCKINIPVRHKDCKHHECYELSSLLQYAEEMSQGNVQKKELRCLQVDCKVKFIMKINYLKTNLVLDYELLTALRQSPAYCLNFNLSTQTQKLENDFVANNGIDQYIQEYHRKQHPQISLNELQDEVLRSMVNLLQQNVAIQQLQIKNKYQRVMNIQLSDPFIQYTVEYPTRCIKCPLKQCCDLRTYLCQILSSNQTKISCPLCNNQFGFTKTQTNQFSKYFYVDFCLQQQLIKNESHRTENKFDYYGDNYLLEDFKRRAQTKEELIQSHQDKNQINIQYNNLNCVKTNKRLNHPLRLPNCSQNNHISFQTLYNELEKNKFDFDVGLKFCACSYCNTNHLFLKNTAQNTLVYEPLFQSALEKLSEYERLKNKSMTTITYNIIQDKLIFEEEEQLQLKKSNNIFPQIPNQGGFIPLHDDEEYQKFFQQKKADNQYNYKILNVSQNFGGVKIDCNQQGSVDNIQQERNRMNQNLQNDDNAKKYNIQITGMQFQIGGIQKQFQG